MGTIQKVKTSKRGFDTRCTQKLWCLFRTNVKKPFLWMMLRSLVWKWLQKEENSRFESSNFCLPIYFEKSLFFIFLYVFSENRSWCFWMCINETLLFFICIYVYYLFRMRLLLPTLVKKKSWNFQVSKQMQLSNIKKRDLFL